MHLLITAVHAGKRKPNNPLTPEDRAVSLVTRAIGMVSIDLTNPGSIQKALIDFIKEAEPETEGWLYEMTILSYCVVPTESGQDIPLSRLFLN